MAVITVTTQPTVDPQTATQTYYQALADEVQAAVDTIAAILPKIEEAQGLDAKQARRNLNVPDVFCYTAINAVEQLPELEAAKKLHAEQCRNRLQFLEAFRPVHDKFETVSRRLKHALQSNKSAVATVALHVLRLAKAQASDNRNPAAAAHVEAMQRDLARKIQTKAEREVQKRAKFDEAVERAVAARMKEVRATSV